MDSAQAFLSRVGLILLLMGAAVACQSHPLPTPRVPVIFDTDLGGDIDDAWALALLLSSPELDLKLAVTAGPDTRGEAPLLDKFLEKSGRADISIGVGVDWEGSTGPLKDWARDYDLADHPGKVYEDGVSAIVQTIRRSDRSMTLLVVGPASNLEEALSRDPRVLDESRVVAMSGSVYSGYPGDAGPAPEYNVRKSPTGAHAMYGSGGDVWITPLDVAAQVRLEGSRYERVLASKLPQTRTLMECYRFWVAASGETASSDPERESSILFDTAAVYLSMRKDLCRIVSFRLKVTPDGFTRVDPAGNQVRAALAWKNLEAFQDFLAERLGGPSG